MATPKDSLKRAATMTPGSAGRPPKLARSSDMVLLEEPPAVRRPRLDSSYIVVLSHRYAIEENVTEKNGYLRGLRGNTLSRFSRGEAEGCEDAASRAWGLMHARSSCTYVSLRLKKRFQLSSTLCSRTTLARGIIH